LAFYPCFFFQAEDGIRDFHVTGVQTCALPISSRSSCSVDLGMVTEADLRVVTQRQPTEQELRDALFCWKVAKFVKSNAIVYAKEIGRASCRERGVSSAGGVSVRVDSL